jgi:nucleoside-diphosphate-sugar epimerase
MFLDGTPAVEQIASPDDTAEGFVLAVEHCEEAANNVFNIAAPAPFRYQDHVEKIARRLNLPYDSARVRGYEPYSISSEKARRLLGYEPKHTMDRMIERALELASRAG